MRRETSWCAGWATLLGWAAGLFLAPAGAAADRARWGAEYFSNVPLVTQDGEVVRFHDDLLAGKIVAIELVYTRCRYVCPLETARLAQVQRLLGEHVGKEVFLYSISIDPAHDTPEVLKAYAKRFQAGPGWLFLTGAPADVGVVVRKLGLSFAADPASGDGHAAEIVMGDVSGGQWMRASAVDDPGRLATIIRGFLAGPAGGATRPATGDAGSIANAFRERGRYLFSTRCSACHTIGHGDRLGPDLLGVTRARARPWLVRYLAAPDQVLSEGDPIARALDARFGEVPMPNLRLGQEDIAALLEYLDEQKAPTPAPPSG